jgi:hypothetical protein
MSKLCNDKFWLGGKCMVKILEGVDLSDVIRGSESLRV